MARLFLVAMLLLVAFPQNTPDYESIMVRDMGTVVYDKSLFTEPDTNRLYELTALVMRFVERECVPIVSPTECTLDPSMMDVTIRIVPYAVFEDKVLEALDADGSEEAQRYAAAVRGNGSLVDGHTRYKEGRLTMYYYQNPGDPLFVHELFHILYPRDEEEGTKWKTAVFISSRFYKDWLRKNY